jgi:peptidoglycan/xylan/chitin deacetylase (PgdA/CDA1 family)
MRPRPQGSPRRRRRIQRSLASCVSVFVLVALIPSIRPAASAATRASWEHPVSGFASHAPTREIGAVSEAVTPVSEARPRVVKASRRWIPYPKLVKRIDTQDPVVFITIDDGWYRDWRLVKLLRKERFPVTLYLTELATRGYRAPYFKALKAAGATIENHTVGHPDLRRLGPVGIRKELCRANHLLERRFGANPTNLRPPYGALKPAVFPAARRCGLSSVVMWSKEVRYGQLLGDGSGRLQRGDIVLFHFRPELREDLEVLRKQMRRQGLKPAALEDYLPGGPKSRIRGVTPRRHHG